MSTILYSLGAELLITQFDTELLKIKETMHMKCKFQHLLHTVHK